MLPQWREHETRGRDAMRWRGGPEHQCEGTMPSKLKVENPKRIKGSSFGFGFFFSLSPCLIRLPQENAQAKI